MNITYYILNYQKRKYVEHKSAINTVYKICYNPYFHHRESCFKEFFDFFSKK